MRSLNLLLVLFVCCASMSCNVLINKTEEEIEKTYPPASNFPLTTINQILNNPPDSGSYNIQVYVVEINECPINWNCFFPDFISISQEHTTTTSTENIRMYVNQPRQFKVGKQYIMSIKVGYIIDGLKEKSWSVDSITVLGLIGYVEV